jgi:polyphenol oxidase
MIEWAAPGPYRVVFSTREGGVSEGPYASLNIGLLTRDEPRRVVENRRRLAADAGADPERATMAHQMHGADVARAEARTIVTPGTAMPACDGLWTDEPGLALMLVTADCLPIALVREDGEAALAVLHVGWRGLLAGIVENGVAAIRNGGRVAAVLGPAIGRCCYEVGPEVLGPYVDRYGRDVAAGRRLDLRLAADRALRVAGVERVEVLGGCTACDEARYFSHRRDGGLTGRQGVLGYVAA